MMAGSSGGGCRASQLVVYVWSRAAARLCRALDCADREDSNGGALRSMQCWLGAVAVRTVAALMSVFQPHPGVDCAVEAGAWSVSGAR